MQALKLLGQQLRKIWQQLGIKQKVKIVLSGIAVVVALTALELFLSRPNYCLLFSDLDAVELERITVKLDELRIRYRVGQDSTSIYIPEHHFRKARVQLATRGILKSASISRATRR